MRLMALDGLLQFTMEKSKNSIQRTDNCQYFTAPELTQNFRFFGFENLAEVVKELLPNVARQQRRWCWDSRRAGGLQVGSRFLYRDYVGPTWLDQKQEVMIHGFLRSTYQLIQPHAPRSMIWQGFTLRAHALYDLEAGILFPQTTKMELWTSHDQM